MALIPVFGIFAILYGQTAQTPAPNETYRYLALIAFTLSAGGDFLDGYVARKLNQKTRLGSILDPLTDKVLMLTALVTLSIVPWGTNDWIIPIWYIIMVVCRDVSIGIGCAFIVSLGQKLQVTPHWTGKATTIAQLVTIGWIMLKIIPLSPLYPTLIAAILTLWSSWAYVLNALKQLNHTQAKSPSQTSCKS